MNLDEIEKRLQALIEVELIQRLPGTTVEDILVQKMAAAIHQNLPRVEAAPNVFTLILHPENAEKWRQPGLLATLMHSITSVMQEAGFRITISPVISITADDSVQKRDVQVLASYKVEDEMGDTKNASPLDTGSLEATGPIPDNAFLIVEGVKVFPLTVPVVNIGRKLDNQLIIDDPRVSRNHAQLRAIKGRFVVFDLNSTGGTFVNGQRTSQSVLYPGDVISLAGVALIFGQDNPPPRPDLKDTGPLESASADRKTVTLKSDHTTAKLKKPQ